MFREITFLAPGDCFSVFVRDQKRFNFPVHSHDEFELNLIINGAGAKRMVGNHEEVIGNHELVLIGPNMVHGWTQNQCNSDNVKEVTIQFHPDFLGDTFLKRAQFSAIKDLLDKARQGVYFPEEVIRKVCPEIMDLSQKHGFDSVIGLLAILQQLATAACPVPLSSPALPDKRPEFLNKQVEKAFNYINTNFSKKLTLNEVARIAGMNPGAFNYAVKKHTGYTFNSCINKIRLNYVSRMLIETTHSVAEIAYQCGFNNLASFNRLFKHVKQCTPKEFRSEFTGMRTFV